MSQTNSQLKNVEIQYFALLREERGLSRESLTTNAKSTRELFEQLSKEHGFTLPHDRLAVAINDEFTTWDAEVKENDKVVFIPPVAGG